jgi:hypothetical protein
MENFYFILSAAGNIILTIGGVNHDYHFAVVMKGPPWCSHLLNSNHPTFYQAFMGIFIIDAFDQLNKFIALKFLF